MTCLKLQRGAVLGPRCQLLQLGHVAFGAPFLHTEGASSSQATTLPAGMRLRGLAASAPPGTAPKVFNHLVQPC